MKYIITLLVALSMSVASYAGVVRHGDTFVVETTSVNQDTKTKYTWQDKEGKSHKIYLSKNGKAFVKVTSKKTGNEYNKYLDEKISIKLSKEYNITYVPKKSK